MDRKMIIDTLGWGFVLWLIGYALGFIFFFIVPPSMIGWLIMPIGIVIAAYVAIKKISRKTLAEYVLVAIAWVVLAVVLDYLFIVMLLNPADGYYKLDVYLYYAFTLIIPLAAGLWKQKEKS